MSSRDDAIEAGIRCGWNLHGFSHDETLQRQNATAVLNAAHAAGAIVWADEQPVTKDDFMEYQRASAAEVVRLRAALEQIAERAKSDYPNSGACHTLAEIARGALRGDDA